MTLREQILHMLKGIDASGKDYYFRRINDVLRDVYPDLPSDFISSVRTYQNAADDLDSALQVLKDENLVYGDE